MSCLPPLRLRTQRGEAAPGEVISINMISLRGGVPEEPAAPFSAAKFIRNVQPATAEAGFDMRLPPMSGAEMEAVERMMREEWAPAALNLSIAFTIQARCGKYRALLCCARAYYGMNTDDAGHTCMCAGKAASAGWESVRDVHGRGC
jgi:hypothetical protein